MTIYYTESQYQNDDYVGYAAWTGFIWAVISQMGYAGMEVFWTKDLELHRMTNIGIMMLTYGIEVIYGIIFLFWTLAFINNYNWGRFYFRTIQWLVPTSWFVSIMANLFIFFGIGQKSTDGWVWLYPFSHDLIFLALGATVYYGLGSGNVEYYRWD